MMNRKISLIMSILLILWITIISWCSSSLVSNLSNVESRANDLARRADISMVGVGLEQYRLDNWSYPNPSWGLSKIEKELIMVWLENIPKDPNNSSLEWLVNIQAKPWEYIYIPLNKKWDIYEWFVLITKTETESWSNRVFDKNNPIENLTDVNSIKICNSFVLSSYVKNMNDWTCYYINTWDLWRVYIHKNETILK